MAARYGVPFFLTSSFMRPGRLIIYPNIALALAFPAAALAVQDCEINGQNVNPANGGTTEGKTGIMKCRDRDTGKVFREEEYRNGRPIGYRKFIEFSGDSIVASYNEASSITRTGQESRAPTG